MTGEKEAIPPYEFDAQHAYGFAISAEVGFPHRERRDWPKRSGKEQG
jgi:hypothetical protein